MMIDILTLHKLLKTYSIIFYIMHPSLYQSYREKYTPLDSKGVENTKSECSLDRNSLINQFNECVKHTGESKDIEKCNSILDKIVNSSLANSLDNKNK
jgi:hypothetical protein